LEIQRKENVKTVKEPIKTKSESHKTEPNPLKDRAMHEGDNPSFLDEFVKFTFILTVQFIFLSLRSQFTQKWCKIHF
jgi:hypothetical protein